MGPDCLLKMTPNVLLIYKLLELENGRKTLDRGLRSFTNRANEEVQRFLNGSLSTYQYDELSTILDAKCRTLNNLLTTLQHATSDQQFCAEAPADNGDITNQLYLFPDKVVLTTDVLKFGPILSNVLLASSITKAIQVLGATLSFQCLKQLLDPKAVNDDVFDSIQPSQNTDAGPADHSSDFKIEGNELVVFKEKPQVRVVVEPPLIIMCQKGSLEILPTKPVSQKTSDPQPTNILMNAQFPFWELEHEVPIQHKKQTSEQLLTFLRTHKESASAKRDNLAWFRRYFHPPSTTPSKITKRSSFKDGGSRSMTDNTRCIESPPKETALAEEDSRPPVFRLKRVEPGGVIIYSCMVLTETELWDMGEVVTPLGPVEQVETQDGQQNKGVDNSHREVSAAEEPGEKPQSPQCTNTTCGFTPAESPLPNSTASIPEFVIVAFKEMEVVVSHVVSPGHFYIQRPDVLAKQQALVNGWKGRSFAEENSVPDIGTLVMAFFSEQKQWCRAQVLRICGVGGDDQPGGTHISVQVFRLDHGDKATVSLRNVGPLTPDMAALPLQAAMVSLADVSALDGVHWTEEAVSWFRAMVEHRTLYARLFPLRSAVTVHLFLERGAMGAMRRGASLSLRLAQNGHAKLNQMKAFAAVKRGNFLILKKRQEADWQKYLIACYTEKVLKKTLLGVEG
ncbi:unnamed protein product [Gadus morhua 'NCC']